MNEPHTPTCPRCGYDLSGPVPTWRESCPMEGVCTECGLDFTWGDVYDEEQLAPRWLVESDGAPKRPWTFVQTAIALLNPLWFWSRVGLATRFRPTRIAALIAGLFLSLPLLLPALDALRFRRTVSASFARTADFFLAHLREFPLDLVSEFSWIGPTFSGSMKGDGPLFYLWMVPPSVFFLWALCVPFGLLGMYATRRFERFRWQHALRGWLYSLVFLQLFALAFTAQHYYSLSVWRNTRILSTIQRELMSFPLGSWARVLIPLYLAVFWAAFFRNYIRFKHWAYVTVAVLIISGMLAWILDDLLMDPVFDLLESLVY